MNEKAISTRYPRLLNAVRQVANLTTGEAICAIVDFKAGRHEEGPEAVCHYGGNRAVIANTWRLRHRVRRTRAA